MKGFVNLGNTCYMNSALQMILRIDNFKQLFQNLNLQKNNLSNEELDEIKILIDFNNKYNNSNEKILNPCDNCKKLRIASKRLEFKSLPSDIIFSIKRYSSNLRKIDKKVNMPLEWKDYKLKGIVFHSGSFGGGHYIYIGMDNNRWYIFNDSFVSEINNMSSLDQYKNHGYLYHYTKK